MKFLIDFLRLKAPKPGKEIPVYYHRALTVSAAILIAYFSICMLTLSLIGGTTELFPAAMLAASVLWRLGIGRMSARQNACACAAIIVVWVGWFIHFHGWGTGAQHFLVPLLMLVFFNVYEKPWMKVVCFFGLVAYRMLLFVYSQNHPALVQLSQAEGVVLQMLNSLAMFCMLACMCILFSSSLQDTERQLRIDNQTLHREAGTDPLTQLSNRRSMLDVIDAYVRDNPREPYGVAIADIDFFKNVNDSYGHNCGDYTLKQLAELFRANAGADYIPCRWGGEEFCFFLPGKNLDEAGRVMEDLCGAVRRMPLSFDGQDFSITITIGVAENDFKSPMPAILEEADHKLYMGKNSGRNQVVI